MKCLFCSASFETKPIPGGTTELEKAKAMLEAAAQAAEGEKWEHLTLLATRDGAKVELDAGYVCPADRDKDIKIALGS